MERTSFSKSLLVVNNRDVLLGKVDNLLVFHFPKVFSNLRNESCRQGISTEKVYERGRDIRKSWETITTPPSNSLMAAARASMEPFKMISK